MNPPSLNQYGAFLSVKFKSVLIPEATANLKRAHLIVIYKVSSVLFLWPSFLVHYVRYFTEKLATVIRNRFY